MTIKQEVNKRPLDMNKQNQDQRLNRKWVLHEGHTYKQEMNIKQELDTYNLNYMAETHTMMGSRVQGQTHHLFSSLFWRPSQQYCALLCLSLLWSPALLSYQAYWQWPYRNVQWWCWQLVSYLLKKHRPKQNRQVMLCACAVQLGQHSHTEC